MRRELEPLRPLVGRLVLRPLEDRRVEPAGDFDREVEARDRAGEDVLVAMLPTLRESHIGPRRNTPATGAMPRGQSGGDLCCVASSGAGSKVDAEHRHPGAELRTP